MNTRQTPRCCCIYVRIGGTGTEFDKAAADSQLHVLRQLSKALNMQAMKEIVVFESGTNHKRASIQELLRGSQQHDYDCVLVFNLKRLACSVDGIQYIAHSVKELGLELYAPSGEEDIIPFIAPLYSGRMNGGEAVGP